MKIKTISVSVVAILLLLGLSASTFILTRPNHQLTCEQLATREPSAAMEASCAAACEAGSISNCILLADALSGEGAAARDLATAQGLYEKACGKNEVVACRRLAHILNITSGKEKEALDLYGRACEGGDGIACAKHGGLLWEGRRAQQDIPLAVTQLEKGCALRNPEACSLLGVVLWERDLPLREEVKQAARGCEDLVKPMRRVLRLQQEACVLGHAQACLLVAELGSDIWLGRGRGKEHHQEEKGYTKKGCDLGDARSCEAAARLFVDSRFGGGDHRQAALLYGRACDLDLGAACRSLGDMVLEDKGAARDRVRAARLYSRACESGDGEGCARMARDFDVASGATENEDQATVYYTKACDLGDVPSCFSLAGRYDEGKGIDADPSAAVELYTKLCDSGGHKPSCMQLARMLERGRGVESDIARATKLYDKSCYPCGHRRSGERVECKMCSIPRRAKPKSLRCGSTFVQPPIPKSLARQEVLKSSSRFDHCFEGGLLYNPNLPGRISVRFRIDAGRVFDVQDSGSDVQDAKVLSCVREVFLGLRFPHGDGNYYSHVFDPFLPVVE